MAHRARALVHAAHADGSLPPAELGLEAWNLPLARPYAFGEAEMYMVELRQRFPAAGSLDARAKSLAEEARAMLAELSSEERLVVERATSAFADYAQAFAEKRITTQQLAILDRMGQAVRARYTSRGAGLADASRVEVETAKLQRTLARLAGDIERSRGLLNVLLRRPAGSVMGEPRELAAETVRLTVDELVARADANRGATVAADSRARAAAARKEAAKAEAHVPEFMVGLGYWQDPTMRPGLGLSASMTLPWLWGPGRERVAQANEEEEAGRAAQERARVDAQAEITEAHARLVSLEAQLRVVGAQELPAARRSLDALAANYTTGNVSLLDWIDATRTVLGLEMELTTLRGDLARAIASLERAVGAALPRTPIQESGS
jgi:outer membrane protein TolC